MKQDCNEGVSKNKIKEVNFHRTENMTIVNNSEVTHHQTLTTEVTRNRCFPRQVARGRDANHEPSNQ